jgi:starch phosphorylase
MNMTLLALNLSKYTNGVTEAHMEYSRKLFPGYHIQDITNGVHSYTWTCPRFRQLFAKYIRGWANEPELLVRVDAIPNEELWEAHIEASARAKELLDFVKQKTSSEIDIDTLTLGFATRATEYKRATMVFSDLKKLEEVERQGKIQLVFAGKAHPRDEMGKRLIRDIYGYIDRLKNEVEIGAREAKKKEEENLTSTTSWNTSLFQDSTRNVTAG